MNIKNFVHIFPIIVGLCAGLLLLVSTAAEAKSKADIKFPVQELGGCNSERECKAYCNNPKRMVACLDFAEKYSLMPKAEIARAKKFAAVGAKGPGGCTSKESCDTYCNDLNHMNECVAFAEKSGMMSKQDLDEAKKVQAALAQGAKLPGGCRSKETCQTYCEDPSQPNRMEECIAFAEAAGFMPEDELREARKALKAMKKGYTPPPCRGKRACDQYCSEPEHIESCLVFAEAADLIPKDELAEAKKFLQAVKRGVKPLPCRGKDECDEYCADPEHIEECVAFAEAAGFLSGSELDEAKMMLQALKKGAKMLPCRSRASCDEYCAEPEHLDACLAFAEAAGFMSSEEAAMARKTGGKGPGGCRSKESCDAYCADADNQAECFSFGLEHGLIPEEDLERMREGVEQMQEALENADEEVMACLENELGGATIQKIKDGTVMPSEKMGDVMRWCFESVMRAQKQSGGFDEGEEFEEGYNFEEQSGSLFQKVKRFLKEIIMPPKTNTLR